MLAENLEKKGYFEHVQYSGYDLTEAAESVAGPDGTVVESANKDKTVSVTMTMDVKSPVADVKTLGSLAATAETEGNQ